MAETSDRQAIPQPIGSSSSPVVGETTQRVRLRSRRDSLAKRIALGVTVATLTATILLWAKHELDGKADASRIEAVERRVLAIEPRVAGQDRDLDWIRADTSWMKQVLWQMARNGGLVVPPPPTQLAPIAAPEAP